TARGSRAPPRACARSETRAARTTLSPLSWSASRASDRLAQRLRGDCAADRRQRGLQRRERGVFVDAAGARLLAADLDGHRRQRLRLPAGRHRVLVELDDVDADAEAPVHGVDERLDEALAFTRQHELRAAGGHAELAVRALRFRMQVVALELPALGNPEKMFLEQRANLPRRDLFAGRIGLGLHDSAHGRVQPLRQRDAVIALEHESDAALARLAVDAHDLLVAPPEIGGV